MKHIRTITFALAIAIAGTLCVGCASTRPLRPGAATIRSSAPQTGAQFASELKQPENPSQSAAQNFERTTETELPLPAGTRVEEKVLIRDAQAPPSAPPMTQERTIVLAQPVIQKTRTTEKAGTMIGAAQKDTAREFSAKLSSLKGIVWVGLFLFVAGIGTIAYPPLRAMVGSVTTSVAMIFGGLALIVLPTLIVGHELIILNGVILGVGGWFLAHRHGQLKAAIAEKTERLEAKD